MDQNFNSSGGRAGASQLTHRGFHPADSFQNGYYGAGTGFNTTDNSFYDWNMQPNGLPGLLASALHNDLLYINGTYTTLFQAYNTMKEKLATLETAFSQLSSSIAQPQPPAESASPLSTALSTDLPKQELYPKVRFWYQADFKAANQKKKKTTRLNDVPEPRGGKRMSEDINVMTTYLEKEDGTILSGKEAQAIRATQTSVYREIQRVSPADLPKTWGSASLTIITYHRAQMYKAHPLLRFYHDHWKVERLATQTYSSWYSKNVKKKAAAVTLGRDGCTCVCTCSNDSPSQSDDDDDDDDDSISRSTSGSTSASSSTSASGPTSISSKSSVASSRPTRKRKISTAFIPSTQPQKRRIASPDPDVDMLDSPESDPAATRAPGADQTLVNITNTAPSATLSAAGGAAPTPIAPIPSTTPPTPSNDSIPLSPPAVTSSTTSTSSTALRPPAASTPPTLFAPSSVSSSNNAPPTVPEVTPASHSIVVVPTKPALSLVNPLNIVFGAPVGPPARSEGLKAASTSVAGPSTSKKAKKRVNKDSLSPALMMQSPLKNLTRFFADLSEEERLKWTRLSTERNKAKKAAKQSAAGAATTPDFAN
ncbi:hypothetical protein R3P38DRAFT_3246285 [Favolaschia claudopus]|uniref:Uncharacterized protein n=1 Tax=Favolaschia claudopus TaxID=2862362 RepID=A0AAV9YZE7_9AGAR